MENLRHVLHTELAAQQDVVRDHLDSVGDLRKERTQLQKEVNAVQADLKQEHKDVSSLCIREQMLVQQLSERGDHMHEPESQAHDRQHQVLVPVTPS